MPEVEEPVAPVAKRRGGLISRQLEAIRRQKNDKSSITDKATFPASSTTVTATSASTAAPTAKVDSPAPPAKASVVNVVAGLARSGALSKSVRLKTANNTAARRLGLPLKGENGAGRGGDTGLKRSLLGTGFAAKAFRAAAAAAASPSKLQSNTLTRVKRRVPPVVRVQQVRKADARPQGTASRALAALVNDSVEQPRRARPRVRLPGVAGALLPVKKQEESDEEAAEKRQLRSHGMASKVITVPQPQERRSPPARRPPQASRKPVTRAKPRRDLKSSGILSAMLGHLNSAKRALSDERTGMKVKEEARWEPEEEVEEPLAEDEEEDEEEAPVVPPPRKRAKLRKEKDRQKLAKAQAAEMRALQRRLETHYSSMKNFIRTRAEPTIFYLPAKHNSDTQKQLEETRAAINHKISSLKVHLQSADIEEGSEEDSGEE